MPSNVIELVVKVSDQATAQLRGISSRIGPILGKAVVAGSLLVGVALRAVIKATKESQAATAQLDAAYKATGETLGRSRKDLEDLATSIQRTTIYQDDLVNSAQAILLTFDKVRGDAFERTIRASTDLAARLGTDLTSAVRTLGVALQDPEQGMQRLRRAGILFTDEQKKIIKNFVETGQTAKAQAFILGEVERRFGGAATAARNTLGGALTALNNAWGDLLEQSEEGTSGLVDAINSITDTLSDPATKQAIQDFFGLIISLGEKAVQTIVGLGSIFNVVGDESERITRKVESLQRQLAAAPTGIAEAAQRGVDPEGKSQRDRLKEEIALLITRQRLLLGLDPSGKPVATKSTATTVDSVKITAATLEQVRVTAHAIKDMGLTGLMKEWNEDTKTAFEQNLSAWTAYNLKIKELVAQGLPQAIADIRLDEKMAELFPPIEITVKKIDEKPFKELTEAGKRAAQQIQDAFANAIRGAFSGDSAEEIAANFLRAFAEIPIQELAEQWSVKVRKAMEPFLAKLLGTVGGAAGAEKGGPTAQERAAGIVAAIKAANAATVVTEVKTATGVTQPITEAVQNSSQSLCDCICSCLSSLHDAMAGGPDAVTGAIGDQTAAQKTIAKTASRDVVAGVDSSIRASTISIGNRIIELGNRLAQPRASTASIVLGAIAGGLAQRGGSSGGGGGEVAAFSGGMRSAGGAGLGLTFAPTNYVTIQGGDDPKRQQQELMRFLQLQDDKQKRWTLDVMRTNFGRVVTP